MHIRKMILKNFRCFKNLEIDFNNQITVLVGLNASGKTSILEALACAVHPFVKEFENVTGWRNIRKEDCLNNYQNEMFVPSRDVSIQTTGDLVINGQTVGLEWIRSYQKKASQKCPLLQAARQLYADKSEKKETVLPVISYYGTARMHNREQRIREIPKPSNCFLGYKNCLLSVSQGDLLNIWLRNITLDALVTPEGDSKAMLDAVRHTMAQSCEEFSDVVFNYKANETYVSFKNGERRLYHQLCDGHRAILTLVADIAHRCARLNPFMLNEVFNTPGVILIDEIELHLHPQWQQKIIETLQKLFPKIQFIVTTHSPQVLTTVKEDSILCLQRYDVFQSPEKLTYGAKSSRLLKNIFETDERPANMQLTKDLKLVFNLIDNQEYEKAQDILNKYIDILSYDPDLIRAQAQIENAKWL